jgi:spore photoproduct lyase
VIESYPFTHSQREILRKIEKDFSTWDVGEIEEFFPKELLKQNLNQKELSRRLFNYYRELHKSYQNRMVNYENFNPSYTPERFSIETVTKEHLGIGLCPVASEGTRCCNLYTLDAVESCGFDCSYCSIQSFYNRNRVVFDRGFREKLKKLKLDSDKIYHIGTGQSSDSLMWGNREGVLEAIFEFARANPNVILELKSKSDNISFLLNSEIPSNVITTWSLNTQTIIDKEEHLTASLEERLDSAKRVSEKGNLIGFHFHPIVVYKNYLKEYEKIYKRLLNEFEPKVVVMVSMGTLTFIKPVLKRLQKRDLKSKVTQIPMVDVNGKRGYDYDRKVEMFRHCYETLKPWREEVFFYLCMEEHNLWRDVFGYEFENNSLFEEAMNSFYMKKIDDLRLSRGEY